MDAGSRKPPDGVPFSKAFGFSGEKKANNFSSKHHNIRVVVRSSGSGDKRLEGPNRFMSAGNAL